MAQYIGDEEKAEQELIEKGILKRYGRCPFGGEDLIAWARRSKYKCSRYNKSGEFDRAVSWKE